MSELTGNMDYRFGIEKPSYQDQVAALIAIQTRHNQQLDDAGLSGKAYDYLSDMEAQRLSMIPDSAIRAFVYRRLVFWPMQRGQAKTELGICLENTKPYAGFPEDKLQSVYMPVVQQDHEGNSFTPPRYNGRNPFVDYEIDCVRGLATDIETAMLLDIPDLNRFSGTEIRRTA